MRLKRSVSSNLVNALLVGAAMLAIASLAAELGRAAPEPVAVGDIIAFEPDPGPLAGGTLVSGRIAVHRPHQFGCILDLDTLRRSGGSLVAEARLASEGQSIRMHWAGRRTAPDSGDCGPNADLIVERHDLGRLAAAAGALVAGIQPLGGDGPLTRPTGF